MPNLNPSLKPFVINDTDIQFILDQVNFKPLFNANGDIIVAWDGTGTVYDFFGHTLASGGVTPTDQASLDAIALVGSSYQNYTDLSGTRDVSGFWNNLTPVYSHYGDTGQVFPRMVLADFSNYLAQKTSGAQTLGPSITTTSGAQTVDVKSETVLFDSGVVPAYAGPGITKTNHEILSTGTDVATVSATSTTTQVLDGHHLVRTEITTTVDSTITTSSYDYFKDETTTVLTTASGTSSSTNSVIVPTTATTINTQTVQGESVVTYSGGELDGSLHGFTTEYALSHQSYAITQANASATEGNTLATDGTEINITNVVDYTPRMISRTTTTAGVVYDTWANHQTISDGAGGTIANPEAAHHTANEIYYGPTGEATVLDWGQLETVANGGLGQIDTQARLAASAGQGDHFIGSLNPGVSPSNGFFVLFGQFFDHGLDFIDKGQLDANGKNVTIKIALGVDDPLYGMTGPDGRPVTEITINRATVQTLDDNGNEYVNHVSPFIDQSQTYGSDAQRTQLLREWVSTDGGASYHAGMKLFDGETLSTPWTKPDGTTTTETLPTLNELRAHVEATGRDALTWDDIGNLRNRDANGHVIAGTSGEALLLDMNPRFDMAHLLGANGETAAEVAKVQAAIGYLNSYGVRPGDTLDFNAKGVLTLTLGSALSMGPGQPSIPAGTELSGASALAGWVNFADFSIMQTPPGIPGAFVDGVRSAVSDILMASVGDHYIAGDGRANENFGLTSIHHVFHEEHNFQVGNLMDALHKQDIATNDVNHDKLHEFQINTGMMNSAGDYIYSDNSIAWDEEKVFQGAKLIVEMEYQHAAVDQYARNVSPNIQEFVGYSPDKMPDVTLEYSQAAFRFGHSTLRETIDTIDPAGGITGKIMGYALHDAFLNPEAFGAAGPGAILLGMTHQQQNEVDEFVTPALNQGLLGQPLDLAAINIARGRDVGLPTLNDFREALGLTRYTSWNDFGQNMQHPSSLVNFIAAYSFDGDLDKAQAIVDLATGVIDDASPQAAAYGFTASQALAFINGDSAHGGEGTLGFNQIDTWLGGLAEIHQPGGLLGETFDLVFVTQIESLMDGDRFYYLYRLFGQQFGEEVANGQLKDLVERNTGLVHLNGNVFGYADQYIDLGAQKEVAATSIDPNGINPTGELQTTGNDHKYGDVYDTNGQKVADGALTLHSDVGVYSNGGVGNTNDGHIVNIGGVDYIQDTRLSADNPMSADYDPTGASAFAQNGFTNLDGTPNSGAESNEVIVGTSRNDLIYAQGGDDTVYGEGGNDTIYGGYGIDRLYGNAGSDTIFGGDNPDLIDGGSGDDFLYGESSGSDINGNDQVIGGSGNDEIHGGVGIDKLSAGSGDDKIYGEQDTDPFTHGGDGNDYVDGGSGGDILYGDNGDDIVVGGADQDQLFGDNGDDILRPGDPTGALTIGSDEVLGGDGTDVNDKGFDLIDFSDNAVRPKGVSFDLSNQSNPSVAINGSPLQVPSFQIDGVVGSAGDDTLIGDDASAAGAGSDISIAGNNWLIGGSGNDTISGGGGDDVIIGGSIRLDALIGKYNTSYDHNNNNDGLTSADQLQDALYQGASHRVAYNDVLDNSGLLGHGQTAMFDKHFTEMLRTEMFKDTVLGDGGVDSAADTAIYTGNVDIDNPANSDYAVVALDAQGNVVADPHANGFFALKITDLRTAADFIDANGNPLVDANGNPLVNEGSDLLVGIENIQFANKKVNVGAFFDQAPVLDLHAQLTTTNFAASDTFSGNPSNNPYGRGAGWSGSWTESSDGFNFGSGRTADNTGQIHYSSTGGDGTGGSLVINGGVNSNGTASDGASISRGVNLSGYSAATVSFRVAESGLGLNETVRVYLTNDSNAPGANDVLVTTIDQNTDLAGQISFDVTGNFSSSSRLYFVASSMNSGADVVTIDNVSVTGAKVVDAAPGNNYTINYTEQQANPLAIALTPHITDPDVVDTTIASAKAVLTDAVAGDRLNVGSLPAGITATGNGTGSGGLTGATTILLSGVASHAAYESALAAITFSNPTNDSPTNADRHVDVTVNDGFRDSAVATTTVHVTPVDDAATALAPDAIVTNIGYTNSTNSGGTTITVADWMLTANDQDVDGVVISGAANVNGLSSVNHSSNSQSVSFIDRSGPGGTFSYSSGALSAQVSVTQQTSTTTLSATSANGQILLDNGSNHTINGGAGDDIIVGGGGNDVVNAGNGDDTIVWSASNFGTDGRDTVDGGGNGSTTGDTFTINGSDTGETFNIYTRADWLALGGFGNNAHSAASTTEIVITRSTGNNQGATPNNGNIIAELRNVEELVINTGGGTDHVNVSGNFDATHLNYNTIHVNDGDGGDMVDITGLTSAHRIVFNTDANGQVVGELRPQDIVEQTGGQPQADQSSGDQQAGQGDASTPGVDDGVPVTTGGDVVADQTPPGDPVDSSSGVDHLASDPITGAGPTLVGTTHDDVIIGTDATSVIYADDGNDVVMTGDHSVIVDAGSGDDIVTTGAGNDLVFGGSGDDVIETGAGSDKIWGDDGNDLIKAGDGDDMIWTGNGDNEVHAGAGDDRIEAGDGADSLWGDGGNDLFVFRTAAAADGDTIADFQTGDKIDLHFMDANSATAANDAFQITDGTTFTGAAQLIIHFDSASNHTEISGNTDADLTTTEFHLTVMGNVVDQLKAGGVMA